MQVLDVTDDAALTKIKVAPFCAIFVIFMCVSDGCEDSEVSVCIEFGLLFNKVGLFFWDENIELRVIELLELFLECLGMVRKFRCIGFSSILGIFMDSVIEHKYAI